MLLSGLGAPPSFASDLHFNVGRVESKVGLPLKGVTMINHLKSKILITGRNFCYLRSPLVARKKKKKIITGYSPKVEWRREGQRGRDSAAASDGGGRRGGGVQRFHPCKRPSPRQAGPPALKQRLGMAGQAEAGIPPVGAPGDLLRPKAEIYSSPHSH